MTTWENRLKICQSQKDTSKRKTVKYNLRNPLRRWETYKKVDIVIFTLPQHITFLTTYKKRPGSKSRRFKIKTDSNYPNDGHTHISRMILSVNPRKHNVKRHEKRNKYITTKHAKLLIYRLNKRGKQPTILQCTAVPQPKTAFKKKFFSQV